MGDKDRLLKYGFVAPTLIFLLALNVFPLRVPPLRERPDDIPLLVRHFVDKYSSKTGKPISTVPREALERLQVYRWPGNVRELENIIERAVILSRDGRIQAEHLHLPQIAAEMAAPPPTPSASATSSPAEMAPPALSEPATSAPSQGDGEREIILEALEKARWNRRRRWRKPHRQQSQKRPNPRRTGWTVSGPRWTN